MLQNEIKQLYEPGKITPIKGIKKINLHDKIDPLQILFSIIIFNLI